MLPTETVKRTIQKSALKGCSKNDPHLKLLCEIRHSFTNYDKLTLFYAMCPEKRTALNRVISNLIKNGPDYIETFKEKVKKIECAVDLNKKEAKKKFLIKEEQRLCEANPERKKTDIKKLALLNLNNIIRSNNQYIRKHKTINNEEI